MNLYRFDRSLHVVEKGQCDYDAALVVYEECYENGLKSYHSGEEAMSFTSFGLSRSDKDFIELSCNGYDSVSVHSDRLHYPSRMSKFLGTKGHLFIKGDKNKGREIIRDFFDLERQEFESKYSDFLCR
jgi:hypothetical protein